MNIKRDKSKCKWKVTAWMSCAYIQEGLKSPSWPRHAASPFYVIAHTVFISQSKQNIFFTVTRASRDDIVKTRGYEKEADFQSVRFVGYKNQSVNRGLPVSGLRLCWPTGALEVWDVVTLFWYPGCALHSNRIVNFKMIFSSRKPKMPVQPVSKNVNSA